MTTIEKKKYTGTVRKRLINIGSKSEHEAVVLDTGGTSLKLRLRGGNPFHDPALDSFVGLRVQVEATALSGALLQIDTVSDIIVLGPPARPSRPTAPKP